MSDVSSLEEYALALVGALHLAARTGGRPAFDSLFDRGFARLYGWAYRLAERNPERAQVLTSESLLKAAQALARRVAEADATTGRDPTR
ncbi:MAG TPA: hypothetical protein DEP35_16235 [Deltaproteobacteria bacterium]|nr:hypothetical protein [Deltaproteobacteria bacterium]